MSALGSWNRSQAVAARTRLARSIPFRPMPVPPAATACHECAEVPGTQQPVENPAVGTTQETSPTSVEPLPILPLLFSTCESVSNPTCLGKLGPILRAN